MMILYRQTLNLRTSAQQLAPPNAAVLTMAVLPYITHPPMGVQSSLVTLDTSVHAGGTRGGVNYKSENVSGDYGGSCSVIKEYKEEGVPSIKATAADTEARFY